MGHEDEQHRLGIIMAAQHTRAGRFQANIGGLVLASAVVAYFAGPFLRFCPPALLAVGGLCLGCAVFLIFEEWVTKPNPRDRKWKMMIASMILGAGSLVWAGTEGFAASDKIDRLCQAAQTEMLQGRPANAPTLKPGQADAKDRYQALGCRYQP